VVLQGEVESAGNSRKGIDEGAIEIKKNAADHQEEVVASL
jgi:hypothetical protein